MAINTTCPHCRKKIRAKDEHAGRRAKCPACKNELRVPGDRATNHDVFITYSSHDKAIADAICESLELNGMGCWIAPRDILPGVEWGKGIIDGINSSRVMVLVYSSSSNDSPQVMRELHQRATLAGRADPATGTTFGTASDDRRELIGSNRRSARGHS